MQEVTLAQTLAHSQAEACLSRPPYFPTSPLQSQQEPPEDGPLHLAASEGNPGEVEFALKRGAAVDEPGKVSGGRGAWGANTCGRCLTFITFSTHCHTNHPNSLQLYETALYKAADKGHLEVVRVLLARGAEVDKADQVRDTCSTQRAADTRPACKARCWLC